MKIFSILLFFVFLVNNCYSQNNTYQCQSPPYFELGNSLYENSPSKRMNFIHELIGIFMRTESENSSIGTEFKESSDEIDAQERIYVSEMYLNGIKTTIITPGVILNDKIIVYFHGGGYIDGMILFQWEMAFDIARKSGSPMYVVDYSLAPESIFPAAIDDGMSVYDKLLETFDANQIVFLGDSAGGGLALGLIGKIRDQNKSFPTQLILISPWLDIESNNPDMVNYEEVDMLLSIDYLQTAANLYVGSDNLENLDNPYASPLFLEDLGDFPPCLLLIGTYDLLYPDAILFVEKAEAQGMNITPTIVEGGFHVWPSAPTFVPESWKARKQIASFINCGPERERNSNVLNEIYSDENLIFDFKVSPNPSGGKVFIEIYNKNENASIADINILDVKGNTIYSNTKNIARRKSQLEISMEPINGIYLVNVNLNGVVLNKKLVIMNK